MTTTDTRQNSIATVCEALGVPRRDWRCSPLGRRTGDAEGTRRAVPVRRRDDRRSMPKVHRRPGPKLIEMEVDGEGLTTDDIRKSWSGWRRMRLTACGPSGRARRAGAAPRGASVRSPVATSADHLRSMSATRSPASAIRWRPRLVRSISFARPSAWIGPTGSRQPCRRRSFTNSDVAARLSWARSASSVSRIPPMRMLPKIWKCGSRTSPYPAPARGSARSSRNSRNSLTSSCPMARRSGDRSLDVAMASEATTVTEVSVSEVIGSVCDDHPEPELCHHRPLPATRPSHRHRPSGRVVGQPVRRFTVVGSIGRRTGSRPHRVHDRRPVVTARARLCGQGLHVRGAGRPPPNRRSTASGSTEPVDWVGNAWGGHVGIRLATGAAAAQH